jgi:serine/threonine-protein kinase RsbW
MSDFVFEYPSEAESEDRVFTDVYAVLEANEIVGDLRRRILQCVSEAFINALVHGNRRDPQKMIKVLLAVNRNGVAADIIDQGKGGLASVKNKQPAGPLAESGRGVDLMRHYSDRADFLLDADGGMKVSLWFDRREASKTSGLK